MLSIFPWTLFRSFLLSWLAREESKVREKRGGVHLDLEVVGVHRDLAEARNKPSELDEGSDAFEDAHVRPANLLWGEKGKGRKGKGQYGQRGKVIGG